MKLLLLFLLFISACNKIVVKNMPIELPNIPKVEYCEIKKLETNLITNKELQIILENNKCLKDKNKILELHLLNIINFVNEYNANSK